MMQDQALELCKEKGHEVAGTIVLQRVGPELSKVQLKARHTTRLPAYGSLSRRSRVSGVGLMAGGPRPVLARGGAGRER